ncbi:MipA/OmpV family protein [Hydrogenophaga defluvii]|uniref:MipA/OmpV family protein n=1 Tax=Hydrogenophaga defluvii TaxID=249410 RepID=A0ABW2SA66_9BURK
MKTPRAALVLLPCLLLWAGQAGAVRLESTEGAEPGDPGAGDYLLGSMLSTSGNHVGEPGRGASLRPLWSVQWRNWRITTTRASALWRLGRDGIDPGVSTVLVDQSRFRLSASLQIDGGRRSGDDAYLAGLPEVQRTLRGRVTARYALSDHWSVALAASHDLRNRDRAGTLTPSIKYRHPTESGTLWEASLSAVAGNDEHLQTFYGITPAAAMAAGRAPYEPRGGWHQWRLGLDVSHPLSARWVVFGGVGLSSLVGDARRSPLVSRASTWGANLGVAYRCC